MKECCNNCKYHQMNLQDTNQVFCRRNPPQGFLVPQGPGRAGHMWAHPALPRSWWCGEYKPEKQIIDLGIMKEVEKTV